MLADDLHVGLLLLQPIAEGLPRALAVLVVGADRRPLDVLHLGRLLGEHAPLLVRVGPQADDVVMPLRPRQRFRERLRRDEHDLVLLGPVGDGETDVRQERAGDQRDLLGLHQILGLLDRLRRLALVVAEDHLELPAEDASLGIDLLDGHLGAELVRAGERRPDAAVRIDLADLDRRLRRERGGHDAAQQNQRGGQQDRAASKRHGVPPANGKCASMGNAFIPGCQGGARRRGRAPILLTSTRFIAKVAQTPAG